MLQFLCKIGRGRARPPTTKQIGTNPQVSQAVLDQRNAVFNGNAVRLSITLKLFPRDPAKRPLSIGHSISSYPDCSCMVLNDVANAYWREGILQQCPVF